MPTAARRAAMSTYELDRHRKADREAKRRRRGRVSMSTAHVCPLCAGPKHHQSLRCRKCYAETLVKHGLYRRGATSIRSGSRLDPVLGGRYPLLTPIAA